MSLRTLVAATSVALAIAGCGVATQQPGTTQVAGTRCASLAGVDREVAELLAPQNVQRVEPLHHEVAHVGGTLPIYVSGARIYVPAERGVSEAYLERALSCHAAASGSAAGSAENPNDPLRSPGVRAVAVRAAGQSFAIAVTGVDRDAGAGIWQRARALRDRTAQVEVEQLASATQSTL